MQEMQEMGVRSLGGKDPLEEGMETHSSIVDWEIPWIEVGYNPWGCRESDMIEHSCTMTFMPCRNYLVKLFHKTSG